MREIAASIQSPKGRHSKMFRTCVGSGHAYLGLRADFQRDLATAASECGFQYLRFHGLLHDDMGVYREDAQGNPVYNWQYVDTLYDYILDIGMKPFVELGFMPAALASGEKTVFYWKANVTPPKDHLKWEALVRALVEHLTERYGVDEVKTWYFEVWNEPNHQGFFTTNINDYYELYRVSVRAVKTVCSDYRVGGPATAGPAWISEMIGFCQREGLPLDFVSTHAYGVVGALDEFGTRMHRLVGDANAIIGSVQKVHNEVKRSDMPELEIHYTEWSTSYTSRDPVHDSYVSAPYILSKLKRVEGLVDSMSYWTFSDIFEEAGPGPSHFHGGFGLMNLQGLKKPSYYAYKFLNELGDEELQCEDPDAWVCKSDDGIQTLFWNYTYYEQDQPNQVFYKRDLPPAPLDSVKLTLSDLEPGTYEPRIYQVGYRVNDVYGEYLSTSHSGTPSRSQIELLKQTASGEPVLSQAVHIDQDGLFTREFKIRQNDVFLVKLSKNPASHSTC